MIKITEYEWNKHKRLLSSLLDIANEMPNYISERQHEAMKLYFVERKSAEYIGLKFGLTCARVRQIIEKGCSCAQGRLEGQKDNLKYLIENTYKTIPQQKAEIQTLEEKLLRFGILAENLSKITNTQKGIDKSLEDLPLSVRAYNCLKSAKINTLKQLAACTEKDLLRFRNFGKSSIREVREIIGEYGYVLN